MRSTAIAVRPSEVGPQAEPFELPEMRVFTSIPEYHHGIVALRGMVVVYATDMISREGVIEGAFYVIEHQNTPSLMPFDRWLKYELSDAERRAQPNSPLRTSREVVQLARWPGGENLWMHRLASGFGDGPLPDWNIAHNMVGKVVGIYVPDGLPRRREAR